MVINILWWHSTVTDHALLISHGLGFLEQHAYMSIVLNNDKQTVIKIILIQSLVCDVFSYFGLLLALNERHSPGFIIV